ncbi:MAG TPA: uracil-DNA glycosylase [Anaeromyxobacteraceae bacterium]|nr:uracil-DNA glycosylase [Anaeromyxobacteraceae bacterium]
MSGDAKELAAEVARHLAWLRDSGIAEVDPVREITPLTPTLSPRFAGGEGDVEHEPVAREESARPEPVEGRTDGPAARRYALTDKGCGSEALLAIREDVGECTRCKLHGGRTRLVFGTGNPDADVMFVGEGPGADEDLAGEPFVGRAGQLLTKMIEAMGFRREDVYIANVVKCRPPGNRNPEPDEIEACEGFLRRQIAAVRPRVVVALGKFAAQTLLREDTPITRLRGRWAEYEGVKLMPTFHPAYLLRSPEEKRKAWEDLQLVMKELGKPLPGRTG